MGVWTDMGISLLWLSANGLLLVAVWRCSRELFPSDPPAVTLMHSILLWYACIVGSASLLGYIGGLTGLSLLAIVSGVGLFLLALASRKRPQPAPGSGDLETQPESGSGSLSQAKSGGKWWATVWGIVMAYWLGLIVRRGLLEFPEEFDTLMYHVPLIDHWLQRHSLYAPECLHWSNPGGNELLGLWMVAPFSGDFFIPLANFPALGLFALCLVQIGKELGLSRWLAHAMALACVMQWATFRQLVDAENDVAVAALFAASVAYLFRYCRRRQLAALVLGGMALGLLAGVKYYALGYALVGWVALIIVAMNTRPGWGWVRAAALSALAVVLFGGHWYIRNAVITGSPVYPLGTTAENNVLARVYPSLWSTTLLGNDAPEVPELTARAFWKHSGPVHVAALLALPFTLAWLLWRGAWRKEESDRRTDLALAFIVSAAGLVWVVTPMAVEDAPGTLNQLLSGYAAVRYGLCFSSFAILGMAVLVQDLSRGLHWILNRIATHMGPAPGSEHGSATGRRLTWVDTVALFPQGVFGIGLGVQIVLGCRALAAQLEEICLIALSVFLVIWGWRLFWAVAVRARPMMVVIAVAATVAGVTLGTALLSDRWHAGFGPHYDARYGTTFFQRSAKGAANDDVICVLDYRSYPFFGSRRQWRVVQPIIVPSYDWLVTYLRDHHAGVIVTQRYDVVPLTQVNRFREMYRWAADHPEEFVLTEQSPVIAIFEFRLDQGTGYDSGHR